MNIKVAIGKAFTRSSKKQTNLTKIESNLSNINEDNRTIISPNKNTATCTDDTRSESSSSKKRSVRFSPKVEVHEVTSIANSEFSDEIWWSQNDLDFMQKSTNVFANQIKEAIDRVTLLNSRSNASGRYRSQRQSHGHSRLNNKRSNVTSMMTSLENKLMNDNKDTIRGLETLIIHEKAAAYMERLVDSRRAIFNEQKKQQKQKNKAKKIKKNRIGGSVTFGENKIATLYIEYGRTIQSQQEAHFIGLQDYEHSMSFSLYI